MNIADCLNAGGRDSVPYGDYFSDGITVARRGKILNPRPDKIGTPLGKRGYYIFTNKLILIETANFFCSAAGDSVPLWQISLFN
jgi:hypothetical protein